MVLLVCQQQLGYFLVAHMVLEEINILLLESLFGIANERLLDFLAQSLVLYLAGFAYFLLHYLTAHKLSLSVALS